MKQEKLKTNRISTTWYAEVAPAIPLPATGPQVYTYQVPSTVDAPGLLYTQVNIPLGVRRVRGVVTRLHKDSVPYPTKELTPYAPFQLTAHQVALATWLHETMRGGLGFTLRLFFPPGKTSTTASETVTSVKKPKTVRLPRTLLALRQHDVAVLESDIATRHRTLLPLAKAVADAGQQILIVVPEKWLLEYVQQAFAPHFKKGLVVIQADATSKQLTLAWQQVASRQAQVIIGTQKSLFLPFLNLGAVIIEEEFYSTHKLWDQYPRLDNRLAAARLAELHHTKIVYSSSVPSLALHYRIQQKEVRVVHRHPLVLATRVIPLTFEDRQRQHLLPEAFTRQLRQWVAAKKRVVILHNVLGSWRALVCRSCHAAVRCPDCDVTAVVHGTGKKAVLKCHHCQKTFPMPTACPRCRKGSLVTFGAGQEKIADAIRALFPGITLSVIEAETPPTRQPAKKKTAEIIVGTSAIFTRLPPQSCDEAVYISPERGLLYPDFRSEERVITTLHRLAQLVVKGAGLPTGRQVVIVTSKPALVAARLTRTIDVAYKAILKERQRLNYPPYAEAVLLTFRGKTAATVRSKAALVRQRLEERDTTLLVRGPFLSFDKMRRGYYEQHLLLLGPLKQLRQAYATQPVDVVDVSPERIL